MTKARPLHREANANPKPSAPKTYPLGMVLEACPDILDYATKGGIDNWRDLATTAATVRRAIGVSPDAWAQALEVMGEHDTSIVIAAILQRGEEIKSAGGYLRVLTAKARAGEFSLGPVLMALLRGEGGESGARTKEGGMMRADLRSKSFGNISAQAFGAKQPELFGAVEQAFDRGRGPAGSAARRALIHGL